MIQFNNVYKMYWYDKILPLYMPIITFIYLKVCTSDNFHFLFINLEELLLRCVRKYALFQSASAAACSHTLHISLSSIIYPAPQFSCVMGVGEPPNLHTTIYEILRIFSSSFHPQKPSRLKGERYCDTTEKMSGKARELENFLTFYVLECK